MTRIGAVTVHKDLVKASKHIAHVQEDGEPRWCLATFTFVGFAGPDRIRFERVDEEATI